MWQHLVVFYIYTKCNFILRKIHSFTHSTNRYCVVYLVLVKYLDNEGYYYYYCLQFFLPFMHWLQKKKERKRIWFSIGYKYSAISIHMSEWRCTCTAFEWRCTCTAFSWPVSLTTFWTSWYFFFTVFILLSSCRSKHLFLSLLLYSNGQTCGFVAISQMYLLEIDPDIWGDGSACGNHCTGVGSSRCAGLGRVVVAAVDWGRGSLVFSIASSVSGPARITLNCSS